MTCSEKALPAAWLLAELWATSGGLGGGGVVELWAVGRVVSSRERRGAWLIGRETSRGSGVGSGDWRFGGCAVRLRHLPCRVPVFAQIRPKRFDAHMFGHPDDARCEWYEPRRPDTGRDWALRLLSSRSGRSPQSGLGGDDRGICVDRRSRWRLGGGVWLGSLGGDLVVGGGGGSTRATRGPEDGGRGGLSGHDDCVGLGSSRRAGTDMNEDLVWEIVEMAEGGELVIDRRHGRRGGDDCAGGEPNE